MRICTLLLDSFDTSRHLLIWGDLINRILSVNSLFGTLIKSLLHFKSLMPTIYPRSRYPVIGMISGVVPMKERGGQKDMTANSWHATIFIHDSQNQQFSWLVHFKYGKKMPIESALWLKDLRDTTWTNQVPSSYFAGEAELVFCPYNYLIDPVIRKAMDVDISNAVLIFDEAHNIEDNAREAASAEIEHGMLLETHSACVRMSQLGPRPDLYRPLADRVLQVKAARQYPTYYIAHHRSNILQVANCSK